MKRIDKDGSCDHVDLDLSDTALLPLDPGSFSSEDVARLLRELQVRYVELEMQNAELRRTQGELELALLQYRDLYDRAPAGCCAVSDDGVIQDANLTFAELLGLERRKLIGMAFTRFISRDDQDRFYLYQRGLKDQGMEKTCELKMLRADATPFWVLLSTVVTEAVGGGRACHIAVSDIDVRKKMELRKLENEARIRAIVEDAQAGYFLVDLECRFRQVNRVWLAIHGYASAEEVLGRHYGMTLVESERELACGNMEKLLRGESVPIGEYALRRKDGTVGHHTFVFQPVWKDGKVAGVEGFIVDSSERWMAEEVRRARARLLAFAHSHSLDELLQETLDELEKITGSLIGFFVFVDPDQRSLTFQNWSTRTKLDFCTADGKGLHSTVADAGVWADCLRERKPVIHNDYAGLPGKKGLPPGHAPVIRELVVPVLRGEKVVAIVGVGNKPGDYDEQDVRIVLLFAELVWEIVDRKRAEEREQALHVKLERALRMESLGVLAGGVAHDLNNILGPIALLPDMVHEYVKRQDGRGDPEHAHVLEAVKVLKSSARRAIGVVSDLVAMGRRGQFHKEHVDVNRVVEQTLVSKQIVSALAARPGVRLVSELANEPAWCMGSASRLGRILANLVGNAVEAISQQGEVSVRVGRQVFADLVQGYEVVPAGDYVAVTVSDTGCGMDAKTMTRMFEPFFSTKSTSERSGSGLGLSVVHGLLKDHGGFLDVKSARGQGTTFTVYLPAVQEGESSLLPTLSLLPGGVERILVVDDEPAQQFLAQLQLQRLGYAVTVVSSGAEAVGLFEAAHRAGQPAPYDIALIDMVMKGGDGLATGKAILALYPGQRLTIVSGHASDHFEADAKALGIGWLAKPYSSAELAQGVRARLDG